MLDLSFALYFVSPPGFRTTLVELSDMSLTNTSRSDLSSVSLISTHQSEADSERQPWTVGKKITAVSPQYSNSVSSVFNSVSSDEVGSIPAIEHNQKPMDSGEPRIAAGDRILLRHPFLEKSAPQTQDSSRESSSFADGHKQLFRATISPVSAALHAHTVPDEAAPAAPADAWPAPARAGGGGWRRVEMEWDPRVRSARLFRINAGATVQVAARRRRARRRNGGVE